MNKSMLACICSDKIVSNDFIGAFQFHSKLQTVRLYQSTGGLHIFVMTAEIIYLLFIIYYMFLQVNTNITVLSCFPDQFSPEHAPVVCYTATGKN